MNKQIDMEIQDKLIRLCGKEFESLRDSSLPEAKRFMLIGKMYKKLKSPQGKHYNPACALFPEVKRKKGESVDYIIGLAFGFKAASVRHAERYTKGMECIYSISVPAATKILQGDIFISQSTIVKFPSMTPMEQEKTVQAIIEGVPKTSAATRSLYKRIERDQKNIVQVTASKYTVENAIEEVEIIKTEIARRINRFVANHSDVIKGSKEVQEKIKDIAKMIDVIMEDF